MPTLEIIRLVVMAVVALVLIIYFSIKAIKNGWLNKIYNAITKAIKEAEATELKGEDKKKYVLAEVEKQCNELGIPFHFIHKLVSKVIDTIISHYNVVSK